MRLIDADELLKDVDRLIEQYEDMMKECENDRRYRLYLDIENEIEGMRTVRRLIELPRTLRKRCEVLQKGEGDEK